MTKYYSITDLLIRKTNLSNRFENQWSLLFNTLKWKSQTNRFLSRLYFVLLFEYS